MYPKLSKSTLLNKTNKFIYVFDLIYNYININKFCLNKKINTNLTINEHSFALRGLGSNLKRFLNYNYYDYNYKTGYNSLGINFLKSRIKIRTKGSNLLGYKMYFKGRFTRKQRAGHL
jgi:hypothetical protein